MRLADKPAESAALASPALVSTPPASNPPAGAALDSDAIFRIAVGDFEAGRDAVLQERDDISFEDSPAPRRLAPYAAAMGAVAYRDGIPDDPADGVEAGSGR